MNSKSTYVFIPAYNEEESIEEVVKGLKQLDLGLKIHVIDDGSNDRTLEKARQTGAIVVSHPLNLGGGASIRTAFTIALMNDCEFLVTLDADGQHEPKDLPRLIEAAEKADLVIGSRFLNDEQTIDMPLYRLFGIKFFSWVLMKITKANITDATSCYRVYNRTAIGKILPELRENQYYGLETIIRLAKNKLRVIEVPITSKRRMKGKSKKGIIKYGYNLLRTILKMM